MTDQTTPTPHPETERSVSACSGEFYRAEGAVPDRRELGEIETRLSSDRPVSRDLFRLAATGILAHSVGEPRDGLAPTFRDNSTLRVSAFKADDQRV